MCHLTIQNAAVHGKPTGRKKGNDTGKTTPPSEYSDLSSNAEVRAVIAARWTKPLCSNFLWGKRVTWTRTFIDPPHHLPALQIHTFLVSQHLQSIWIADAASFHGGLVSSRLRSSGCIPTFQRSTISPSAHSKTFSTGQPERRWTRGTCNTCLHYPDFEKSEFTNENGISTYSYS